MMNLVYNMRRLVYTFGFLEVPLTVSEENELMNGRQRLRDIERSSKRLAQELKGYPNKQIYPLLLLRLADRALDECFEKMLSSFAITAIEYHMLAVLEVCDNSTSSPGELAELVGQTRANTTRILDSLSKKKLIRKKKDFRDGRRSSISITKSGRECVMSCTNKAIGPHTKAMMSNFSEPELAELGKLIRKLIILLDDKICELQDGRVDDVAAIAPTSL